MQGSHEEHQGPDVCEWHSEKTTTVGNKQLTATRGSLERTSHLHGHCAIPEELDGSCPENLGLSTCGRQRMTTLVMPVSVSLYLHLGLIAFVFLRTQSVSDGSI